MMKKINDYISEAFRLRDDTKLFNNDIEQFIERNIDKKDLGNVCNAELTKSILLAKLENYNPDLDYERIQILKNRIRSLIIRYKNFRKYYITHDDDGKLLKKICKLYRIDLSSDLEIVLNEKDGVTTCISYVQCKDLMFIICYNYNDENVNLKEKTILCIAIK